MSGPVSSPSSFRIRRNTTLNKSAVQRTILESIEDCRSASELLASLRLSKKERVQTIASLLNGEDVQNEQELKRLVHIGFVVLKKYKMHEF